MDDSTPEVCGIGRYFGRALIMEIGPSRTPCRGAISLYDSTGGVIAVAPPPPATINLLLPEQ